MELKIGKVAQMTGLSSSGIRYLEDEGIIVPTNGRKGKYRNYDIANVSDLLDFRNYRECGFSLENTSGLIKSDDLSYVSDMFDERCDELIKEIIIKQNKVAYLRQRQKEIRLIQNKNAVLRCKRPAMVLHLLNNGDEMEPWPDNSGFDIPYTDSCLLFDENGFKWAIGCYGQNYNMLQFTDFDEVKLLKEGEAIETIIRVNNDLSVDKEEFDKVISYAKENNLKLGKAVSKRIVTLIEGESKVRYDHLWVDLI